MTNAEAGGSPAPPADRARGPPGHRPFSLTVLTAAAPGPCPPLPTAPGYRPACPAQMRLGPGVEESQLPDLALYERLIGDGIAAADGRGSAVDHVTARRLAICLAALKPRTCPTWSVSPAPERSARRSRPSRCTPAPPPTPTSPRPPG